MAVGRMMSLGDEGRVSGTYSDPLQLPRGVGFCNWPTACVPEAAKIGKTAKEPVQGAAVEQVGSGWELSATKRLVPETAVAIGKIPGVFTVFCGYTLPSLPMKF